MAIPRENIVAPRRFLVWARPGGEEVGRVELMGPVQIGEREPNLIRTAEEATIPAGCVLRYVVEQPDDLMPRPAE